MKPFLAVLGVLILLGIAAAAGSSGGTGSPRTASSTTPADPPKFTSMSTLLTSDENMVSADLTLVSDDAELGQNGPGEPACYNLQNNVLPDVRALGIFVSNDVKNDVNELQADIDTLEADIGSFNQDIADFVNDGVPAPAGATGTVAAVRSLIASEITSANVMITTMLNDTETAYTDADNLATGACSVYGPGSAPTISEVTSP